MLNVERSQGSQMKDKVRWDIMASSERDFIRVEYLELKLVSVVLKQSNGIYAFCGFDKKNDTVNFVDFNNFESAMKYAEEWVIAKKNGVSMFKWDTTPIKKKKK